MKTYMLLFLICLGVQENYAQFGPKQIITEEAGMASDVFVADIDGDGDMDVLSANTSNVNNISLTWYENLDGFGDFGEPISIDNNLPSTRSIFAADLDGDGDMDVLSASYSDDIVVWYENIVGLGNFGSRQIIDANADGAYAVMAADLDNDGDNDVIAILDIENKVVWYENDGLGNFGNEQIITSTNTNGRAVITADIDGDNDLDIVASASGSTTITYWYENIDGLGNFGSPQVVAVVSMLTATEAIFAIDLDGDNDLDVIVAPNNEDTVLWFENLDGVGTFGTERVVSTTAELSNSVFATDIDLDGDNDVLYLSRIGVQEAISEISWSENLDGLGNFGPEQIINNTLFNTFDVFAADLDNDGDMDALSASLQDDTIAWYENYTILGVEDNIDANILIHPNPVNDILIIDNNTSIQIEAIKIYDVLGRLVFQEKKQFNSIDVSKLNSGLLFVQIQTDKGIVTKKVVKL